MLIKNELLNEKYKTQKTLNEQSNNDLKEYFKNIDKIVKKTEKEKHLNFKRKEHQHC